MLRYTIPKNEKPLDSDWIALKNNALENNFQPYAIVTLDRTERQLQLMSFPFYNNRGVAVIMARRVEGDPTTLSEVDYVTVHKFLHFSDLL